MKNFKKMLLLVVCLLCFPNIVNAFELAPVAVLTFDRTKNVSVQLEEQITERVKRGFYFPYYQILDKQQLQTALKDKLPQPFSKKPYYNKEQIQQIASTIPADVVFILFVDRLDQYVRNNSGFILDPVQTVIVNAEVIAYDKKYDIYTISKISYWKSDAVPISTPAEQVLLEGVEKAVEDLSTKIQQVKAVK